MPRGELCFFDTKIQGDFSVFFGFPTCQLIRHSNVRGELFSCAEKVAEMRQAHQFPLYLAILHKISIGSYCPDQMGILLILSDSLGRNSKSKAQMGRECFQKIMLKIKNFVRKSAILPIATILQCQLWALVFMIV